MKKVCLLLLFGACVAIFMIAPLPRFDMEAGVPECDSEFILHSLEGNVLKAKDFSLLSWNVYKEQKGDWEKDFTELSRKVDILALQESPLINGHNRVLDILGYSYNQTIGFRVNGTSFGVVIGVGGDLAGQATRSCSLRAIEPVIRIPKTAILTRIATETSELLVVSIHSVNFSMGLDTYREQLATLSRLLSKYRYPIIIAGDFNTWSDERQRLVDEFALELDLQSVKYIEDNRSMVFSHVLDHVFVRGLYNVHVTVHKVESSDHSPIRVDFSLSH